MANDLSIKDVPTLMLRCARECEIAHIPARAVTGLVVAEHGLRALGSVRKALSGGSSRAATAVAAQDSPTDHHLIVFAEGRGANGRAVTAPPADVPL